MRESITVQLVKNYIPIGILFKKMKIYETRFQFLQSWHSREIWAWEPFFFILTLITEFYFDTDYEDYHILKFFISIRFTIIQDMFLQ